MFKLQKAVWSHAYRKVHARNQIILNHLIRHRKIHPAQPDTTMAHLCDIGFFPICSSHFDRLIQKCVRMPANNQINTTDRFRQTQIIYPARFLGEAEMTQADDIVAMMMKPEAVDCSPGYPDRVQRVDLLL